MIVRHGTRYLNKMYIALMKAQLPKIRDLVLNSTEVPNGMVIFFTIRYQIKYHRYCLLVF